MTPVHLHAVSNPSGRTSPWARSFDCAELRPLIVCRGPVRKEAIDVFKAMGITECGMLLSEKDSTVYTYALAPELRQMEPRHVHRVKDYTGASKEERVERTAQIISIAHDNGYNAIFAGYGFMAEDEDFVSAIEDAGLRFVGPGSHVVRAAGRKDEAKRTALNEGVSVTPGVNNATARTLLAKHPDRAALAALVAEHQLEVPAESLADDGPELEALADEVLEAGYAKGIDLYTVDELLDQLHADVADMLAANPGSRVRLKAIGGGGGKGQRIVDKAEGSREKAREILSEVKATGVGDNKNILVELNIETTRHNEIQLVGNGTWTVALGGRDCSLQMHEQKLLEVSITDEGLAAEIETARAAGRMSEAAAIESDRIVLARMEQEAERFGVAVGLDSASTFECIVDGDRHFFMEVNTRIQVEHRVSELCYALRFRNPDDPEDYFDVDSLVECMALLACHAERLPRPERVQRQGASVEARLNATDRSLHPHAGGVIVGWSDPIEGEIRDDQGICQRNPDTGMFMRYRLAGAYDSNIALLLASGDDRRNSYERLSEILRLTRLRGTDLSTNLEFHYGLVSWFLARGVMAKPTTRFVVPYLTQVGLLAEEAEKIDVDVAFGILAARLAERLSGGDAAVAAQVQAVVAEKQTLLTRVLRRFLSQPHVLSAWLSRNCEAVRVVDGAVRWNQNPLVVLDDSYWVLNMAFDPELPAAQVIWDHDHRLLQRGLTFYRQLGERLGGEIAYTELSELLASPAPPESFDGDASLWTEVRRAHIGFQCGVELLAILASIGDAAGFYEMKVEADLTISIPERLHDVELQKAMRKVLVPPPATRADEIVAVSGGMYYAREAPDQPPLIEAGAHVEAGQPLYVLEVMKMFNKVVAPFAGTIDEVLIDTDGTIVTKGQPLFKVTPDERLIEEDPKDVRARVEARSGWHIDRILG